MISWNTMATCDGFVFLWGSIKGRKKHNCHPSCHERVHWTASLCNSCCQPKFELYIWVWTVDRSLDERSANPPACFAIHHLFLVDWIWCWHILLLILIVVSPNLWFLLVKLLTHPIFSWVEPWKPLWSAGETPIAIAAIWRPCRSQEAELGRDGAFHRHAWAWPQTWFKGRVMRTSLLWMAKRS